MTLTVTLANYQPASPSGVERLYVLDGKHLAIRPDGTGYFYATPETEEATAEDMASHLADWSDRVAPTPVPAARRNTP